MDCPKTHIAFTILVFCLAPCSGFTQQKLNQLPGYSDFRKAASSLSSYSKGGRIRQINWSNDFSRFSFVGQKGKQVFNVLSGKVESFKEFERYVSPRTPLRRRKTPVPRAEQRKIEPSNNGKWTAIYSGYNLKIVPKESGKEPIQLTTNGTERLRYGTGCWVYGEELDQDSAMWWSPDDRFLAFYEVNEEGMKDYHLTIKNTERYSQLLSVRYPKAGDVNPKVAILVYELARGKTRRLKIDGDARQYLYNIRWTPDGKELLVNRTNRRQNELDVLAVSPETGVVRTVVSETQKTWQENAPAMRFLKDGKRFVWETEKNGWRNFELRHLDGRLLSPLSQAKGYPADKIHSIDEKANWFYFTAFSGSNPYNKQLHRVQLDGKRHSQLTISSLNHTFLQVSPDHRWVVATREDINHPPATVVYPASNGHKDKQGTAVIEAGIADPAVSGNRTSELFSFLADDGKTRLYGTLHKPLGFQPEKKYPLLIDVYGGPGSQGLSNRYRPVNPYCELGYCIAKVGNRGTVGRGKAFESANYMKLGGPDLKDQADAVAYLAKRKFIDGSRVGIYGHSYGGYLSALALLKFPKTFHVAVAGAPVTRWEHYDTIYTERYMRTPKENPDGYRLGSCMEYAKNLEGRLLLVHGLVDDNVHPANTWELVNALHRADKRFDLQIYPGYKHGIGSTYFSIRWEYFHQHLQGAFDPSRKKEIH